MAEVDLKYIQSLELKYQMLVPSSQKAARFFANPERGPKLVLVSGGSGASGLSRALVRYTHNSVHIITIFDNGGSSRILRQVFKMEPPGDLRNRLMDLADMTHLGNPAVAKLFKARLSKSFSNERLEMELKALIDGTHPLMQDVEPGLASIIRVYLGKFKEEKPRELDLRGGSIGNFVLTGSYLMYNRDIESAVHVISSLALIRGTVVPVARGNYHLGAILENGSRIIGQARITNAVERPRLPIQRLTIVDCEHQTAKDVRVSGNPRALEQLRQADVIIYSIGSFYTSIIPNLLVDGIGKAIRQAKVPKVLLANAVQDDETRGLSVSDLANEIVRYAASNDPEPGNAQDYLNVVVANWHGNSQSYRGQDNYLPVDKPAIEKIGVSVLEFPLEIPTERGRFDPELLARIVISLANA